MDSHAEPADLLLCAACRQAVTRAYRELREHGFDDVEAFRAAARVLSLRHPDRAPEVYSDVVSRLLSSDHV